MSKTIQLSIDQVPDIADAIFGAASQGEVVVRASPAARTAINRLFPDGINIGWRAPRDFTQPAFPADWLEFNFQLAAMIEQGLPVRLPSHLLKNKKKVRKLSNDQVAMLLAIAARDEGIRTVQVTDSGMYLFSGPSTHN